MLKAVGASMNGMNRNTDHLPFEMLIRSEHMSPVADMKLSGSDIIDHSQRWKVPNRLGASLGAS